MLLFRAFFLLLETNRGSNFKRKTFSCQWKSFSLIFLPEEADFMYSGNVFFNECFIPGSGNTFPSNKNHFLCFFRHSCRRKIYFLFSEHLFLNKYFIFLMETVTLLESFFLLVETVNEQRPIFKDKTYSCWWKLTFWLVQTIFFHFLIYFSRSPSSQLAETHFSVQKNSIVFYSQLSSLPVQAIF